MLQGSVAAHYAKIIVIDFEFVEPEDQGMHPDVVCVSARDLVSNQRWRLWLHGTPTPCPFDTSENTLFVGHYFSAEAKCFEALNWPRPARVICTWAERRCKTNGAFATKTGLLATAKYYGVDAMTTEDKDANRSLIISGGPWTDNEKSIIQDYCDEDVRVNSELFLSMQIAAPYTDDTLGHALVRGSYMYAAGVIEHNGVPLDSERLARTRSHWGYIRRRLIDEVNPAYGVYLDGKFNHDAFRKYINGQNIPWPRTATGRLETAGDTFRKMARTFPQIAQLYELKTTLDQLKTMSIVVGSDGRNRVNLNPFGSKTGRNQPSNSKSLFGGARWLRGFIQPEPGKFIAYLDWSSQEIAIAACLSGDEILWRAYASGDPYMAFAHFLYPDLPADATKNTHPKQRDIAKIVMLAVSYGMSAFGIATRAGVTHRTGKQLFGKHRETYTRFWAYVERCQTFAAMDETLCTPFGWQYRVHERQNDIGHNQRSIQNWPMQSAGADMMRLAVLFALDSGVEVALPVHDALLVHGPVNRRDEIVETTRAAMVRASSLVLGLEQRECRVDVDVYEYPARYMDQGGKDMWDTIMRLLDEAEARDAA